MHHNDIEEFLGIDVGSVRIGLARGSSAAKIAEPITTLAADEALVQIAEIAKKNTTTAIVVGLPRGLDGQETEQTREVIKWAEKAKNQIDLAFYWQDEALTSHKAKEHQPKTHELDSIAAAIILQDFLDSPEIDRVKI